MSQQVIEGLSSLIILSYLGTNFCVALDQYENPDDSGSPYVVFLDRLKSFGRFGKVAVDVSFIGRHIGEYFRRHRHGQ